MPYSIATRYIECFTPKFSVRTRLTLEFFTHFCIKCKKIGITAFFSYVTVFLLQTELLFFFYIFDPTFGRATFCFATSGFLFLSLPLFFLLSLLSFQLKHLMTKYFINFSLISITKQWPILPLFPLSAKLCFEDPLFAFS